MRPTLHTGLTIFRLLAFVGSMLSSGLRNPVLIISLNFCFAALIQRGVSQLLVLAFVGSGFSGLVINIHKRAI